MRVAADDPHYWLWEAREAVHKAQELLPGNESLAALYDDLSVAFDGAPDSGAESPKHEA